MAKMMVFTLVLLLQLLLSTNCSQSRFVSHGSQETHGRGPMSWVPAAQVPRSDVKSVFRSEVMHRDHIRSPLRPSTPQPLHKRFLEAIKRSNKRRSRLDNKMKRADFAREAVALRSPVSLGSGEYVMEFSIGSPAQRFTTIVDTGSDLCWVQCLPCTACFSQNGSVFDPTKSTTYRNTGCDDNACNDLPRPTCSSSNACLYIYGYGDSSTTQGNLAYDSITLGPDAESVSQIAFGCGHSNQGSFSGAEGLVGLGLGPLSLPSQLSRSVSEIFSYCLVNFNDSSTTTSPLTFGDAAENSGVQYTPLLPNTQYPSFYYVGVDGISVGGQRLNIPTSAFYIDAVGDGGSILDSGTTITYWRDPAFLAVSEAFQNHVHYPIIDGSPYGLDLCFDMSGASTAPAFPNMVIHFMGVDFEVPPENTQIVADDLGEVVCLAMGSSSQFSIIGNIQQQNHLVVYDVVGRRVGFQPMQCDAL